jgi:hydroxymethylpyrimidine/phosphomethylpyrimidine kinase
MKSALTIAGSDPTGGAGLQADLKVFRAFRIYGYSVPSALTAQNTEGVGSVEPVGEEMFRRQMELLLSDVRPDALKTGMLYTPYAVEAVADAVSRFSLRNMVVDPVTVSSTGVSLVEDGTLDALKKLLFPAARVITPNIYEASVFTGMTVENEDDMLRAARSLREMGPAIVIVTGGHLDSDTVDVCYDGDSVEKLKSRRIEGDYHGTGCAFSAAIAAFLALGRGPIEAAREAKKFVQEAIRMACHPGRGMGLLYF